MRKPPCARLDNCTRGWPAPILRIGATSCHAVMSQHPSAMEWHVLYIRDDVEQIDMHPSPEAAIEAACLLIDDGRDVYGSGPVPHHSIDRIEIARIYDLWGGGMIQASVAVDRRPLRVLHHDACVSDSPWVRGLPSGQPRRKLTRQRTRCVEFVSSILRVRPPGLPDGPYPSGHVSPFRVLAWTPYRPVPTVIVFFTRWNRKISPGGSMIVA